MKKWLVRIALFLAALVVLVLGAIGFAWWTTNPPSALSPDPPPPPVVLAAPEGPLRVGAAAVDISPESAPGMFLAGYHRRCEGVHDPIFARAIAFERGEVRVVLVVVDAIGIHHHHARSVASRLTGKLAPDSLLVLATHAHSSPDVMGLWGPNPYTSGVDPRFLDRVLGGAATAAERAVAGLRPARLKLALGGAPEKGVSRNDRDPTVIDREVLTIAADGTEDGRPIATAVVFACHPEVLARKNALVTADYPGVLLREVEARRGGTGIFLNGPLGGMVTPDIKEHSYEECERVGRTLADVVLSSLADPAARTVEKAGLGWARRPILAPIQNRRFIAGRKLFSVFDRPFEGSGYVRTEACGLTIGPLRLATVPGEALPRVGFDVKEKLQGPFRAVLGLASDELGYIVPEDAWIDEQRYRYEKTMSAGPLATGLIRSGAIEAASLATAAATR